MANDSFLALAVFSMLLHSSYGFFVQGLVFYFSRSGVFKASCLSKGDFQHATSVGAKAQPLNS